MRAKIEPRYRQNGPVDYLNRNPVKNLPKLLDWADTFCAGKFEGQRRAIRKACLAPTDAHYPMVQHMLNDIDPEVLKTTLVNFFIYGNIIGCEKQDQLREKYQCSIPWAILMDPTSACNLHCTGCWAAECSNKLNLSLDELDDIICQGRDMGVYFSARAQEGHPHALRAAPGVRVSQLHERHAHRRGVCRRDAAREELHPRHLA